MYSVKGSRLVLIKDGTIGLTFWDVKCPELHDMSFPKRESSYLFNRDLIDDEKWPYCFVPCFPSLIKEQNFVSE